jgi:hypothetical protein
VSRRSRTAVVCLTATAALLCSALAVVTQAEVVQQGHLRVSFEGRLSPTTLPRSGAAPVSVSVGGKITTTDGASPPQLRRIAIAINRVGHLNRAGLPVCRLEQIQPSTTTGALEACPDSLVGKGRFSADVLLPDQAPFPSDGEIFAFNGTFRGRPAILAHVYGTEPAPTSYTLPFRIGRGKGTFGTMLSVSLPNVTSEWGHVTGLSLTLGRRFTYRGQSRSYLTADCPAPAGFPGASFPFARASFGFSRGLTLDSTLVRNCRAKGG